MLAAIVDGRAGFAELSRGFWRKQGAAQFIVDGNEKTCVPDSFMVAARNEDIIIPKTELPELPPSSATVPRATRSIAQPAPATAAPATDLVVAKRTRSASPPPVRAAAKKPKRLAKSPTKPVARGKKSAEATLKESVLSANWVIEQFLGPLEDWDGDQPNQHTIERDHKGELYTSGALPVFHLEQRFYFFTALDDVCLIALPVVPSYADPLICLAGCGFRGSPRGGKGHPRNHGH